MRTCKLFFVSLQKKDTRAMTLCIYLARAAKSPRMVVTFFTTLTFKNKFIFYATAKFKKKIKKRRQVANSWPALVSNQGCAPRTNSQEVLGSVVRMCHSREQIYLFSWQMSPQVREATRSAGRFHFVDNCIAGTGVFITPDDLLMRSNIRFLKQM